MLIWVVSFRRNFARAVARNAGIVQGNSISEILPTNTPAGLRELYEGPNPERG